MAEEKASKEPEKPEKKAGDAAAPAAEGEGGGEEAGKKKLGKKMLIIMAAGAVAVLAAGGGAAFFMLHKSGTEMDRAASVAAEQAAAKPAYYPLGDLLVNLSGTGNGHPHFLKVKINIELADEKDIPLMESIKPRIVDEFQVYLRELRIEDLRGSAGIYRLRQELLLRVTEAAAPVRIKDVLFQEMLVQ